jgi:MFS family permease
VLAVVSGAQFMVLLDSTVVNVALPRIVTDLGFTVTTRPWILDAYTITLGALLLLGSRLADLVSRRAVFLAGLGLFTVASLACGLATDPAQLIAARAAQGVGAAMLSPAAFSIITVTFPAGRERNVALGVWGGLGGLGATVGVVAGGLLIHLKGWPWIFYVNVPLGVLVAAAAVAFVRVERRSGGRGMLARLNAGGAILATGALFALVLAIVTVHEGGWTSPVTLSGAGAAMLLFAGFAVLERRAAAPLLPRRLRRDRHLLVGAVSDVLVGAVQLSVLFVISLHAQVALGFDPLRAGLSVLPMGVIAIVAAVTASRLVHRVGARAVYAAGTAVGLLGVVLFAVQADGSSYVWSLLVPSLLVGICLPTASVVGTIVGTAGAGRADSGVVAGILSASFQVGSTLGLAVTATVTAAGVRAGYLAIGVFAVLGLVHAAVGFRLLGGRRSG